MVCDWWISIHFVCLCVSRFVSCDLNYDWRKRKTQLWRRLLNFRVRMFVKSAVMTDWITAIHWSELGQRYFSVYYILIFQCFISAVELTNPSVIFFFQFGGSRPSRFMSVVYLSFPRKPKKKKNGAHWLESTTQTQKCVNVNNRQVAAISGTASECWKVLNSLKSVHEQSVKKVSFSISPRKLKPKILFLQPK